MGEKAPYLYAICIRIARDSAGDFAAMFNVTDNRLTEAALALADRGKPVFACGADKRPVTRNGFHAATTDPATIRRMFAHPAAELIGLPTGPASGIDVLDIDPRNGGLAWLEANLDRIAPTRCHVTKSGGYHLIYRHDSRVRCSASRIAPGVDVRGAGGYAIWPPSQGWQVCDDRPPEPWPLWLLAPGLVLPPEPAPAPNPISLGAPEPVIVSDERYAAYVAAILATLSVTPDGAKYNTLLRIGLSLGGVMDASEINEAGAVELLLQALPPTVLDWNNARLGAVWAIREGRKRPIVLADRPIGGRV
jgi:hypothetical protein